MWVVFNGEQETSQCPEGVDCDWLLSKQEIDGGAAG